jgi:hypothetical protein
LRKKQIIDAISWVWTVNLINETNLYKEAKNVVYISEVWDLRWITVTTDELKNIWDDLKNGNAVVLSSGTKVYAWDSRQVLWYLDESSWEISSLVIPKNSYIELKSTLKVVSWEWFVKTGKEIVYSWTDVRNLVWKPLFFWTEISYTWNENETVETSYIDLKYYDNTEFSLNFNYIKSWKLYDLWITWKSSYSIVTSINNDFYYAKIKWFKDEIIWTISNQILLSPQIQADNYAPELILSSIKVPVYQKKTFSLLDYIYEDSWIDNIKDIYIDFDLKTDNDGDWNPKNDNDSSSMSTLVISKWEDITLEVWTFDILMNKEISVIITDSNWNVWNNEIQFEVYSPIPEIENNNVNNFYWVLDEELTDEPVNLYRLRWWVVTKLEDSVWKEFVLSNSWAYNFIVWDWKLWVKIENNGALIAEVNEKTGKITVHNPTYIINVLESNNSWNESVYPKISLSNSTTEVFFETIRVNSSGMVKVVENFEWIESSGIYVKFLDTWNYTYNINPENVVYNPWTMAIYRNSSSILEELFVIFSDWRIRTLNQNYTLKYSTYADYVVLKLVDKHFNREVAEVLYKVESDYVIN